MDLCKFGADVLKLFIQLLLAFFVLTFGAILILQTPPVKYQVKKMLISAAKEKGVELSIDKLYGNLPFEWTLGNVTAEMNGQTVFFETIKARIAILPLFKKHLEFTHIKMHKGHFNGAEFEGTASVRIDLQKIKPLKISYLLLEGDDLYVKLSAKIQNDLTISEGNLTFRLPDASILSPHIAMGSLSGSGAISKHNIHFECLVQKMKSFGLYFPSTTVSIHGKKEETNWGGTVKLASGADQIPIEGKLDYRFSPSCHLLSLENLQLTGPDLHVFGKIDLDSSMRCIEGTIFAKITELKSLEPLFPKYLSGRLGAKIDFQSFADFQDLKCQIEAKDLSYGEFICDSLTLESSIYDLFGEIQGDFDLEASQITGPKIEFEKIKVHSNFEPETSPFTFFAVGNIGSPIEMSGKGGWKWLAGGISASIDEWKGTAFNKVFALTEICNLELAAKSFKVHNFFMNIGEGTLFSRIDLSPSSSIVKIRADEFPLEFIPLPHRYFSLGGIGHLDIDLIGWESNLEGTCNLTLKRALFVSEDSNETVTTKGSLQVHLSGKKAQFHGELKAKGGQFAHFSGTVPILYRHLPFQLEMDRESPFSAELVAEAKVEELLNFINIGHHRIEGWAAANFHVSKTLDKPMFQGDFEIHEGVYENYYSGTCLKDVSAKGYLNKQNLIVTDLYAVDGKGGSATATGHLLLSKLKKFPFSLSGKLNQFEAVTFDTITGNFSGDIVISGDQTGAIAKGQLHVDEATFRIPDQLPTILPELPITFVNPPEHLTRKKQLPSPSSPLKLDLDLNVPGKAFVEGRGLSCELKGKLHLTGNFFDIKAKGDLHLIHGEYIFSGKVFDLTQGEVLFNDKPTPSSYISLSGDCDLPDVNVTVMLRGPITSPTLSFQSSPQLPTSSLLSQILFNKDISEISAVQALQVAQTVISLSGSSAPDVLGKIRKTLGIDRLTIITSENDPGKISLQIGKYLMRGVLLTLSQGAESRNVSVEVELKKGIRFQAEMNEDQQGKFSLKWHHHY